MISDAPVTVVIPCFNHGRFIAECIRSLEGQTHKRWQAIVVDDASTDAETPAQCDAVESERVKVVHLPQNKGRAGARRVGIAMAQSEAVMSLDADDLLEPTHFARTLAALLSDPQCGIVYTDYARFGARKGIMHAGEFDPVRIYVTQYIYAGSLFRKSAYEKTAGYRAELNIGNEDWDLWLSIIEAGYTGTYIREPLYRYRYHPGSWSSQSPQKRAEIIRQSRELLRDFHRQGYERTGTEKRFNRDTELDCAKLFVEAGMFDEAKQCLQAAQKLTPLAPEVWTLRLKTRLLGLRGTPKPRP